MTDRWRGLPLLLLSSLMAQAALGVPSLDTRFGTGGRVILSAGGMSSQFGAALIQSDGKIVVVGNSPALPPAGLPAASSDFLVARFNPDGSADTSFGGTGLVRIDFDGDEDAARAIVQQPDGKLVVAGWATRPGDEDFAVARLMSDGALDPTFSGDGKQLVNTRFNPPPSCPVGGSFPCLEPIVNVELAPNRASALLLQEDGRIVVAGISSVSALRSLVFVRLMPSGEIDNSYGDAQDGRKSFYVLGPNTTSLGRPLLRSATEALVAGTFNFVQPFIATVDVAASTLSAFVVSGPAAGPETVLVQPDGRVLLAGAQLGLQSRRGRTWLVRANSDLGLDPDFGVAGIFTTSDLADNDGIKALALEPGGKILSAGFSAADRVVPDPIVFGTLRRFTANGAPDTTFGVAGIAQIDFSEGATGLSSRLESILRSTDGKLIVAGTRGSVYAPIGYSSFEPTLSNIILARLDSTPLFELREDTRDIGEATTSPSLEVSRIGQTTGPVSVDYVVRAGSATAGEDFVASQGTLTWNPNDPDARPIPIQLIDGAVPESAETVIVELSNPTEGSIKRSRTTVNIVDNDVASTPPPAPPASSGSGGGGKLGPGLVLLVAALALTLRRRCRLRVPISRNQSHRAA